MNVLQNHGMAVQELQKALDENERLRVALELIAAFKGKTIFNFEPEFRDGAHAAYEQAADIAIDALATVRSDCGGAT